MAWPKKKKQAKTLFMHGGTNFHIYWSSDDLCSLLISELPLLMIRFPNKEFATIPTPMGTQSLREFKIFEEPSLPIKETRDQIMSFYLQCSLSGIKFSGYIIVSEKEKTVVKLVKAPCAST